MHVSANHSPTIVTLTMLNATLGEEIKLNVTTTDVDGDSVNLTLVYDLPAGAAFDSAIGNFIWTPINMDAVNIS